jgi:hypothetical protein
MCHWWDDAMIHGSHNEKDRRRQVGIRMVTEVC